MKTNNGTNIEYLIERRPVTHYMISVIARGFSDTTGRPGRVMVTKAVSVGDTGIESTPIIDGEKVITCVPAAPGNKEVFVTYRCGKGHRTRSLGIEIMGDDRIDWEPLAKDLITEGE